MDESQTNRVSVSQAAHILGIKEESVRKRVSRGKLHADKDSDGRLLVYVTGTGTVRDESADRSVTDRDELVGELRDRVRFLEDQLQQANERDRENRRIVAALTSRIPELEAPVEAEAQEAPASPGPADAGEGSQTDPQSPQQRPWWRRVFGG